MYYISRERYFKDLKRLTNRIKAHSNRFDLICCIPRGGLFIGVYLSYKLDKPLVVFDSLQIKHYLKTARILLVDELVDSGATLQYVIKAFNTHDFIPLISALYLKNSLFSVVFALGGCYEFIEYARSLHTKQWVKFWYEGKKDTVSNVTWKGENK